MWPLDEGGWKIHDFPVHLLATSFEFTKLKEFKNCHWLFQEIEGKMTGYTSNAYWLQPARLFLRETASAPLFYSNQSIFLLEQFIPFNSVRDL